MAETTSRENYFFNYKPSIAGVVIAAITFGAITALHIHQFVTTFKTTRIKILIVLSMASFNEFLGYVLRIPGSKDKPTGGLFPLSPLLLLFSPVMATSVMYYIYYKISTTVAPQNAPFKPSLLLKILSGVDVVGQLTISAGAMTAARERSNAGKGILLAGIAIHIVNVVVFTAIVVLWHRRVVVKLPAPNLTQLATSTWRDLLAVYVACGLIILRSLLRFAEFASGPNGPFQDHEAPFYIYDFLPIAIALVACLQWYKSENLRVSP
ncbi:hypothetical protein EKO04_008550 [Ascochyta lentis]|uniref:RTA1 like protein n=1 Tax=Ascochyta lentis TaxID=205686 RepID=A0A8H7J1J4_9PLEO|nr:hypothetical protein EKO04_008550 [Ascochyta lentis]